MKKIFIYTRTSKMLNYKFHNIYFTNEEKLYYVHIEKRNGQWLLWDDENTSPGLKCGEKFPWDAIEKSICRQLKEHENCDLTPSDIEYVGLKKLAKYDITRA